MGREKTRRGRGFGGVFGASRRCVIDERFLDGCKQRSAGCPRRDGAPCPLCRANVFPLPARYSRSCMLELPFSCPPCDDAPLCRRTFRPGGAAGMVPRPTRTRRSSGARPERGIRRGGRPDLDVHRRGVGPFPGTARPSRPWDLDGCPRVRSAERRGPGPSRAIDDFVTLSCLPSRGGAEKWKGCPQFSNRRRFGRRDACNSGSW